MISKYRAQIRIFNYLTCRFRLLTKKSKKNVAETGLHLCAIIKHIGLIVYDCLISLDTGNWQVIFKYQF